MKEKGSAYIAILNIRYIQRYLQFTTLINIISKRIKNLKNDILIVK